MFSPEDGRAAGFSSVAKTKPINRATLTPSTPSRQSSTAPPAYKPFSHSATVQPKSAPPPVYRPNSTTSAQPKRVAPPVYRPVFPPVQARPAATPVYRPIHSSSVLRSTTRPVPSQHAGSRAVVRTQPASAHRSTVQRLLKVNGVKYSDVREVANLMANDENIGWDDAWTPTVNSYIQGGVHTFATLQWLEHNLEGDLLFRKSSINQPPGNGQCYSYSPSAAIEISGGNSGPALAFAQTQHYSMGGGPTKTFKESGYKTKQYICASCDPKEIRQAVQQALQQNQPVTVGVTWTRNKRTGNHWVYAVDCLDNHLIVRDQQNQHILGLIDMTTWRGGTDDLSTQYTATKVAIGIL